MLFDSTYVISTFSRLLYMKKLATIAIDVVFDTIIHDLAQFPFLHPLLLHNIHHFQHHLFDYKNQYATHHHYYY